MLFFVDLFLPKEGLLVPRGMLFFIRRGLATGIRVVAKGVQCTGMPPRRVGPGALHSRYGEGVLSIGLSRCLGLPLFVHGSLDGFGMGFSQSWRFWDFVYRVRLVLLFVLRRGGNGWGEAR